MKTLLSLLIITSLLVVGYQSQLQAQQETAPELDASGDVQPDPAVADEPAAGEAADRATGEPKHRWRYKRHNGRWWYWLPNEKWVYWENGQWNDYVPGTLSSRARPDATYVGPSLRDRVYVPPSVVLDPYRNSVSDWYGGTYTPYSSRLDYGSYRSYRLRNYNAYPYSYSPYSGYNDYRPYRYPYYGYPSGGLSRGYYGRTFPNYGYPYGVRGPYYGYSRGGLYFGLGF